MATLAQIFSRVGAPVEARACAVEAGLRPLPNEDIYFYVKRIDNRGVQLLDDPRARRHAWRVVSAGSTAALLLIGALLPSAYGLLAGRQLESLRQQQERLLRERAALQIEEEKRVAAGQLERMAAERSFAPPNPEQIIYVTPEDKASLAQR